ncbi:hypothetical protein Taro_007312, partial [Colocasia esculenta]|nr:hypothetical protein [Colocasia esculenta]
LFWRRVCLRSFSLRFILLWIFIRFFFSLFEEDVMVLIIVLSFRSWFPVLSTTLIGAVDSVLIFVLITPSSHHCLGFLEGEFLLLQLLLKLRALSSHVLCVCRQHSVLLSTGANRKKIGSSKNLFLSVPVDR